MDSITSSHTETFLCDNTTPPDDMVSDDEMPVCDGTVEQAGEVSIAEPAQIDSDANLPASTNGCVDFNREYILSKTKGILESLEMLRLQHIGTSVDTPTELNHYGHHIRNCMDDESQRVVELMMRQIEMGIDEANVILASANYARLLEAQCSTLNFQVEKLCRENEWLRGELEVFQNRWQLSEQRCVEIEEQLAHLVLTNDLKHFDEGCTPDQEAEESDADMKVCKEEVALSDDDNSRKLHEGSSSTSRTNTSCRHYPAGDEIPARIRTLHSLIIQYAGSNRLEIAIPLCKQAVEDLERQNGHTHKDVALMLNLLGLLYRDQGDLKEACRLLHDSLEIREKTLGPDHPIVALTLSNLAIVYSKRGRYNLAVPLCKRSLEIREKLLGKDHPEVAKQLNNLALLYQSQGKYDEVELYYKRAIEIYELKYGSEDVNVAKTKNNLASAYLKQCKFPEAERLYKEVLSNVNEKEVSKFSSGPPTMHSEVADENKVKGEEGKARSGQIDAASVRVAIEKGTLIKGVLAGAIPRRSRQRSAKVDCPTVTTTLKNLCTLYVRQGNLEAVGKVQECMAHIQNNPVERNDLDSTGFDFLRDYLRHSDAGLKPVDSSGAENHLGKHRRENDAVRESTSEGGVRKNFKLFQNKLRKSIARSTVRHVQKPTSNYVGNQPEHP